jgi:hypothetical protein
MLRQPFWARDQTDERRDLAVHVLAEVTGDLLAAGAPR